MDWPGKFHALNQERGGSGRDLLCAMPLYTPGGWAWLSGHSIHREVCAGLAASSVGQESQQVDWRLASLGSAWAAGHNGVWPLVLGISLCLSRLCFSVVCSWCFLSSDGLKLRSLQSLFPCLPFMTWRQRVRVVKWGLCLVRVGLGSWKKVKNIWPSSFPRFIIYS